MKKIFSYVLITSCLFLTSLSFARSDIPLNQKAEVNLDASQFFKNLNPYLIPQKNLWDVITTVIPTPAPPLSCKERLQREGTLESRLESCPELTGIMIWETGSGARTSYTDWPRERKDRLNILFQKLLDEESNLGINCVDPVMNREVGGLGIYLPEAAALDTFLAHVAHVFYLEATNKVPWSFLDRPQLELSEFFDSSRYHSRIIESPRYGNRFIGGPLLPLHIQPGRDFQKATSRGVAAGNVTLCDPRIGYQFLTGERSTRPLNLIGSTEEETLAKITWWFQQNVIHGDTTRDGSDFTQWATLENRLKARSLLSFNAIVAPEGCHHAASILYDLAKSINIPLLNIGIGLEDVPSVNRFASYNHRGLAFHWEGSDIRILTHIDDLFARRSSVGEIFPIDSEGRPLSENQKIRRYFEVHWETHRVLESWAFHYLPDLPIVTFNSIYDRRDMLEFEERWNEDVDFGQFAGWWPTPPAYPAYELYRLEKSYQLCDKRIVEFACSMTRDFSIMTPTPSWVPLPPILRTEEDYRNRAAACVEAYGGCPRVLEKLSDWNRDFGQTVIPTAR